MGEAVVRLHVVYAQVQVQVLLVQVLLVLLSLCLILPLLLLVLLADTPGAVLSPVSDPVLICRWDAVPAIW